MYSEQIDNAAWVKTNSSVTTNSTTAPDGNATADLITTSVVAGGASQAVATVSGTMYTASFYVKAGTSSLLKVAESVSGKQATFNLTNKTASSGAIQQIGNSGFYRVSVCFTAASTSSTISVVDNSGNAVASFHLWGAQLEAVSKASSYIRTTSATASRAADVNTSGLLSNLPENDFPVWNSGTSYNLLDTIISVSSGVHKVYQAVVGSKSGTATVSIGAPATIGYPSHGFPVGSTITFSTTGALPTGITAGTVYFVLATGLTPDTFQVATTSGGTAINTSGTQSGTHTVASTQSNINKNPSTNPTYWLDLGSTNRWRMFDQSVQSQTTGQDVVVAAIRPTGRVNSLALLNVNARAVRVIANDPVEGVIYDKTLNAIDNSSVVDWYSYFYELPRQLTDFTLLDLPHYSANLTLNVIAYNTENTVGIGAAVIGLVRDIGTTEVGARVGIQDYSIKTRDNFGNYSIVQRPFNKTASYTVYVESNTVDYLEGLLAGYRATPIVYMGEESIYKSTVIYGFYKNFDIAISYSDGLSVLTIDIEGLV